MQNRHFQDDTKGLQIKLSTEVRMINLKRVFIISMIMQGLIWLAFSGITLLSIDKINSIIIAVLMIIDGACFIVLAFIFDRNKFFKICTIAFIIINLILTVTDQMGIFDYIVLLLNILSFLTGAYYLIKSS